MRLQGMPAPCVALLGLGATAPMNVKAAAKKTALSALEMYNPDTKVGFRLRGRLSPLRAMKQLRILILRVWHGATGSLNDGRIQNPSNPSGIVPLSNFVLRGFGFVHHSIAILDHEVPNLSLTIRNFFIAVSPPLGPVCLWEQEPSGSFGSGLPVHLRGAGNGKGAERRARPAPRCIPWDPRRESCSGQCTTHTCLPYRLIEKPPLICCIAHEIITS